MGEVDHSALSLCAFLSSDDLALSVVDLARSAHLTFMNTELLSLFEGLKAH